MEIIDREIAVKKAPFWRRRRVMQYGLAFLFILPALINFTVFRYFPIGWAFRASLWDYSLLGGFKEFIGADNYIRLLGDKYFWQSLSVTVRFFLMYVPTIVILALALAAFANQNKPGMGAIRAMIYVPVITSFVVVSIVWGMLLHKDVGIVNSLLQSFGLSRISFLMDKNNALPTIVMISVWKDVGYCVIIFIAGFKGVSKELYEAATVDGANKFMQFIKITLPMISRQFMFVIVWATLGAFQVIIPVYSLTQGGPARATNVIVYHIYRRAFEFGEMGYASAMSMVLLALLLVVSVVQMRFFRRDY